MSEFLATAATHIWTPILFLLILGGLFFLFYSRFIQYRYFFHSIAILRGKHSDPNAPGQINAYEALSTALAATVGMGNLAGVAAAINIGGPGAIFWMWVTALVGMSTNFFTSTLALMYRGKNKAGELQGGPMYVIREALGKPGVPLAAMFSVCVMVGCLPIFQANQLTQIIVDIGVSSEEWKNATFSLFGAPIKLANLVIGIGLCVITTIVVMGGIKRIGVWAGKMVPLMILVHFGAVLFIILVNIEKFPHYLSLIFTEAFSASLYHGEPALGGLVGGLIITGVRRAAFSNEAGIGTAPMALSTSKSSEPIQEGLVSMLSPAIDTLLVCTLTAFAILMTDVWQETGKTGISLTLEAFNSAMPNVGAIVLLVCASFFAITTLFSYNYYGYLAMDYLAGKKAANYYNIFYLASIIFASVAAMKDMINIIDIAYALMAVPTMLSGFILAPRVMAEAKRYFDKMKK